MVTSKMKMKMKVEEFEEGEIISEEYFLEDGEFIPPQLLLETRRGNEKQGHDPIKNSYILDSMVMSKMKMKVDDFEQGEITTQQDFLEDGEFIPPQLTRRGKEKHCHHLCHAHAAKGRKSHRFGRSQTHVGDSSKPNSLGAPAHIISAKEKHPHHADAADGARGRKRERFADANSLGGAAAADVRLTGVCTKKQKICDLADSDEVTQLSKLLRATELKLKCAGVILRSQSAPDFPAAKLRHSCL